MVASSPFWFTVVTFCLAVNAGESRRVNDIQFASVIQNASGGLNLVKGKVSRAVAWGSFQDTITEDGWSYLEIRTNPNFDDEVTAYAAGALEANLTRHLMDAHLFNLYTDYCRNNEEYCDRLTKYFQAQLTWMNQRASEERFESGFWNQVYLMLKQLTGLDDAYQNQTLKATNVYATVNRLFFTNNEGAMYDLEGALGRRPDNGSFSSTSPCSMLVKKTDKDLLVGHTTWWVFRGMLRIQKKYAFDFKLVARGQIRVQGHTISMPSYPGKLNSMDDFYVISSGLVVTETTNDIYNKTLYKLMKNETVPASFRVMAANRISYDGKQWTRQFVKHNSGTYNNQWTVIDYNKVNVTPEGIQLGKDTFWMLEQLPTRIVSRDMTDVLSRQGYWSSYNIPYFPEIYKESGFLDMFKKHGDRYSHDNCPRAKIFQRDQFRVGDPDSMITMLRYNDFKRDPFSKCNCTPPYSPVYAIAARYDLVDPNGVYDDDDVTFRADGAVDVKVANLNSVKDLSFHAICGPTSDQQPAFSWSKSAFNYKPMGHPDTFNFTTVRHRWSL